MVWDTIQQVPPCMLFMGNQPKLHNVASVLLIAVPYLVKFHWQKNQKRLGIHSNTQTA